MTHPIIRLEDYERFIGAEAIARIQRKARPLADAHVTHINATYYGGGVAEILSSLTLLMNSVDIPTEWRVLLGSPDFFAFTKKMHNALQGAPLKLSDITQQIYEDVIAENALRNHFDHDIIVVHDPQPLPLITHYKKKSPWIWRCHIDLSHPHRELWSYLVPFIERYDAVILSIREYAQPLSTPQVFFMPAIDPFTTKNRALTETEMDERLAHYHIPTDLPLVVQVSRFDPWKDPLGVIQAFKLAQKEIDATLVLLGNFASDDPEGIEIFEALQDQREDRILILPAGDDTALVNTLQRRAAVVLQKSTREGFGLTITEAMWKGTPVIGGNVGGIRYQIQDGVNGFLVSSVEQAAARIVHLIRHPELRERMGRQAQETVRQHFLLTRLLEQEVELFTSFETSFRLKSYPGI
ncbi:MAG TPA: glycosyltransferase [Herpetosiphonaceae bacterium]